MRFESPPALALPARPPLTSERSTRMGEGPLTEHNSQAGPNPALPPDVSREDHEARKKRRGNSLGMVVFGAFGFGLDSFGVGSGGGGVALTDLVPECE